MMKGFLVCAILTGIGTGALCAQNNDSVPAQHLGEVVVKANLNSADAEGIYFIPSMRQKNSAQNGIDLLRRMAIPQIKVGLADDNVKTATGESVPIYINYTKASPEELEGLKTTDVRKVEYFFSPSDQRFMGERNVVNIIVQPYVYGGYTKASLNEKFLIGLASMASIYSKFTYKRMTYDFFVGSRNFNNHHIGFEKESEYFLPYSGESPEWIVRTQTPERMRYSQNAIPVSLRAAYSKKGFQMKNTVAFSFHEMPASSSNGIVSYIPTILESQNYATDNSSRANLFSYNGNFNFNFPSQYYLTLTPKATYGHNRQDYIYTSADSDIANNADARIITPFR